MTTQGITAVLKNNSDRLDVLINKVAVVEAGISLLAAKGLADTKEVTFIKNATRSIAQQARDVWDSNVELAATLEGGH
jgi:hypothetical protein